MRHASAVFFQSWTAAWPREATQLFALKIAFPWLDGAALSCAAALALTVVVLALAPTRARRALLPAAILAWSAIGASPAFAAALLLAAWLFSRALRASASLYARLTAAACVTAGLLAASRTAHGFGAAAAWQLSALVGVRAVSAAVDAGPQGAGAGELLLYFCGGWPASFLGAYYTFASFREAARDPRPRLAGLSGAAGGLGWLALAVAVRSAAQGADLDALNGGSLWICATTLWAGEMATWIGAYRLIEGLSRLCGLDLPSQFDRPWRSASVLDFWRRYAAQNRDYLLKYVLFPLRRGGVPPSAAVAAVFLASALLNALRFRGAFLNDDSLRTTLSVATTFILFFAAFGAAAAAEARFAPAARASLPRRAACWAVVVWLWTPLLSWPPSARVSPRAAAARWLSLETRMLTPWRAR